MKPSRQIQEWSDKELNCELERKTGDIERDVEREAIRRLIEKVNCLVPREQEGS